MFKIGEFSKLSQVPIKTLRYYHSIGLLSPAHVDDFTGYRYYSAAQLARLNRILALKDLGFSLEQIGHVLDESPSTAELRGLLKLKRAELEQDLAVQRARLARVEARLHYIEKESTMPEYDVVIKEQDPLRVAYVRDIIPNYRSMRPLYEELYGAIGKQRIAPTGPSIGIFYDEGYQESDVDVAVAVPVAGGELPEGGRVEIRELPAARMASVARRGPWDDFTPAYQALMTWIEQNGYRIVGPNREIYLAGPGEGIPPEEFLVEIQFPVEK